MSLTDIAALIRRHVIATVIVLVISAIVGFDLHHTKPLYGDTVDLDLKTPSSQTTWSSSLVITADLVSRSMMSPQAAQLVRQAGGSSSYQVTLVNLYNMELPDYSVPYISVTATAGSQTAAQDTFGAVTRVLAQELKDWQAGKGIPAADQINLYTMAASGGAIPLSGSPTRTFAALLVLTIIALFMVLSFLDRKRASREPQ